MLRRSKILFKPGKNLLPSIDGSVLSVTRPIYREKSMTSVFIGMELIGLIETLKFFLNTFYIFGAGRTILRAEKAQ